MREYVVGVVESENNTNVLEGGVGAEEDIIGVTFPIQNEIRIFDFVKRFIHIYL